MPKSRTRLVNFRVSDDEFARLKAASDSLGNRCLSEYARHSMLASQDPQVAAESYDGRLQSFHRRLAVLERSMARLGDALAGLKINAASDNGHD